MRSLTKILLAATLLTCSVYTSAKANTINKISTKGNVQDRHLSGFNAINLAGSFDVYITQGANESVKVEAPDDVLDHVVTEVDGGVLKIHNKNSSGWSNLFNAHSKKIVIYISAKDINKIDITGSGDVYFKSGLHTNTLALRLSGSGDVYGKLDVKSLESSISGSGDIKLSGRAENSEIHISGSGDFDARDMVTANTKVHLSGSGDAEINANNNIEAYVSGSGDIRYKGSAKNISKSKSGSGDISRF